MRASLILVSALAAGCGGPTAEEPSQPTEAADPQNMSVDTGGPGAELAALRRPRMYYTCGDPVCRGHTPRPGVPQCSPNDEGRLCPVRAIGRTCDPGDGCNRLLECRRDPSTGPCPISKAEFKHDIAYLSADATRRLHDELMGFKLATWQYNWDAPGTPDSLGFIIDDVPASAAVAADGGHVNLYGYTTMAVASLQEQQRQIDAQKAQIDALKAEIDALKAEMRKR